MAWSDSASGYRESLLSRSCFLGKLARLADPVPPDLPVLQCPPHLDDGFGVGEVGTCYRRVLFQPVMQRVAVDQEGVRGRLYPPVPGQVHLNGFQYEVRNGALFQHCGHITMEQCRADLAFLDNRDPDG